MTSQAAYAAPEALLGSPITTAVDLWALGCITYEVLGRVQMCLAPCAAAVPLTMNVCAQMLVGVSPFRLNHEYFTMQQVLNYPHAYTIDFPPSFPRAAKVREPTHASVLSVQWLGLPPHPTRPRHTRHRTLCSPF